VSRPHLQGTAERRAGGSGARAFRVKRETTYVDEWHSCYDLRGRLRRRLGEWLARGQMYGAGQA